MRSLRRWWYMRYCTTIRPAQWNRHGGRVLTTDEWEAAGGWNGALVPGWYVERPDWWDRGTASGVTDESLEKARARLDEWQDDQWKRARA